MPTIEDATDDDVKEALEQAALDNKRETTKYGDGIDGKAGGKREASDDE
jgi:hypothetical protein